MAILTNDVKLLLKQGDAQIKEIKEQQLIIISNYIKSTFGLEKGTIIITNKMRGVIVGFIYHSLEGTIDIKYRRLTYKDSLEGYTYTTKLRLNLETDGKYNGKLS